MDLPWALAAVVAGAIGAGWGGRLFVNALESILLRLAVPPALAGAGLAAAATSTPELFVSLTGAVSGSTNLALGDALGSNIVNIGVILGLGILAAKEPPTPPESKRDRRIALLAPILTLAMVADGRLSRIDGIILIIAYATWLGTVLAEATANVHDSTPRDGPLPRLAPAIGSALAAMLLLIGAAETLIWGGVTIAKYFGMPAFLIGHTIVALGTSLPELATTLAALHRNNHQLAIGTLVGSNIFNGTLIVGTVATISPVDVPMPGLPRTLIVGFLLTWLAVGWGRQPLAKWRGILLLATYWANIAIAASTNLTP